MPLLPPSLCLSLSLSVSLSIHQAIHRSIYLLLSTLPTHSPGRTMAANLRDRWRRKATRGRKIHLCQCWFSGF
ncbi:hypothetical protein BO82DRAFT_351426 [Aspergillus uvarum CBS 121591]|uniref:Uncharacterized protein n=1 Tax=Aspergillus uvarum CBS 121591 TaxID=1448315 RepID=A0A319CGU4_9EURO|nr:hypothetical protein BO82DRAFT_351426 [Aspergillus uvarum CBS 121591]PYH85066.1 hypothetical protein BO82DRAFT_351426 [Aspergillus uvarum CBS 121591]